MKLIIPKDVFSGNPTPPRLFLCTTGKKRIGELNAYDVSGTFKWNSYSEITHFGKFDTDNLIIVSPEIK